MVILIYGTDPEKWKPLRGPVIAIRDLGDEHLANIIVMLAVGYDGHIHEVPQWPAIKAEALRRGLWPNGIKDGKVASRIQGGSE